VEEQSFPCCLVISQSNLLFLLVLVSVPRFLSAHNLFFLKFSPCCHEILPAALVPACFFLRNIFWVPHQVRLSSFIACATFFRQFFGLRCPFSMLKIFIFCRRIFPAYDSPLGVLVGFAARLRSCPNQWQELLRFTCPSSLGIHACSGTRMTQKHHVNQNSYIS
jgi:hypothetical protein